MCFYILRPTESATTQSEYSSFQDAELKEILELNGLDSEEDSETLLKLCDDATA